MNAGGQVRPGHSQFVERNRVVGTARRQGKAVMHEGMSHYPGTVRNARDSVEQRTMAPGVVVRVTRSVSERLIDNKWQTVNRRAIRLFEFDGALIRRIIEYGW